MILRETIDEVKNRIDIVDVVSDFVSLKRSGQNYKALSPFTNEKTPSFYVVPSKGIFKDFSSGKGGDAITFVMEHEGMSYVEAIRYLAKKYGVEVKEDTGVRSQVQDDRESLYIVMNFAREYYKNLLLNHEEGKSIGLSYFRERGFNDRSIEKFDLGYSLDSWDHFTQTALRQGFREEMLEKAGLAIIRKEEGKKYDRFRGRVIFPVHNLSGKVVAFGARMLGKEKDQPKYINSPETEIYHKGQVLYGLFQAKNAIRREDFCYLVEGYTDVISLHQAGIENVVASSGTALTEDQIRLIHRFTPNLTVLYDGDAAGIKAATRGIDMALKGGLNVRIVLLPDGEDPDSYARKTGSTGLKKYLEEHSRDFISFKIDLYSKEAAQDPIRKTALIQEIVASVAIIPDPLKRTVYLQECSKKLEIPVSVLATEVRKILIKNRKDESKDPVVEQRPATFSEVHSFSRAFLLTPLESLKLYEQEFIKVMILLGNRKTATGEYGYEILFRETQDVSFVDELHTRIVDLYRGELASGKVPGADEFLRNCPSEIQAYLAGILVQKYAVSNKWMDYHIYIGDEYTDESIPKAINRLKYGVTNKLRNEQIEALKKASGGMEEDSILAMLEQIDTFRTAFAQELGIVVGAPSKLQEP